MISEKLSTMSVNFAVVLSLMSCPCQAFQNPLLSVTRVGSFTSLEACSNKDSDSCIGRRSFMATFPAIPAVFFMGEPATAKDEIFRPSPLTNSLLEQVRIWEQAEADNLKYGGELEAGDAGNKGKVSAYPSLLLPILKIEQDLGDVQRLVSENAEDAWTTALKILQEERFEKTNFKKTFNKYGDNIYYSDPDRANLYLGGGATPKTEQSLAYLLRNDILTNVENLRAELEYLLKSKDSETEDLYLYATIVNTAMKKYLAIVPPKELEEARRLMTSSS